MGDTILNWDSDKARRHEVLRERRKRCYSIGHRNDRLLRSFLLPVVEEPIVHAETLVGGKTEFVNRFIKSIRGIQQGARENLLKDDGDSDMMRATVALCERFDHRKLADAAWHYLEWDGWLETLGQIPMPPGEVLPSATTPEMVVMHYRQEPDPEPFDPEKDEVEVTSHLPEGEHEQAWDGSARTRRGTIREIMRSSRQNRAMADGTLAVRDEPEVGRVPREG